MNLAVLEQMSTEALSAIRDKASAILQARGRSALRVGATAHFTDKNGRRRTITVHRVNAKSVTGVESTPTGTVRWRVSPQFLTIEEATPLPSFKPAIKHVPTTETSATW